MTTRLNPELRDAFHHRFPTLAFLLRRYLHILFNDYSVLISTKEKKRMKEEQSLQQQQQLIKDPTSLEPQPQEMASSARFFESFACLSRHNDDDGFRKRQGILGTNARTMPTVSLLMALLFILEVPSSSMVTAWSTSRGSGRCFGRTRNDRLDRRMVDSDTSLTSSSSPDFWEHDIARLKAKATAELEKAKAKLEQAQPSTISVQTTTKEDTASTVATPFFATIDTTSGQEDDEEEGQERRQSMIKAVNETTGLITADGEKMAAQSEREEWQSRSLVEVFDVNELIQQQGNDENGNNNVYRNSSSSSSSMASQQLANRDVAASIWNLRKQLQTEDYKQIFDVKNRFIGETD